MALLPPTEETQASLKGAVKILRDEPSALSDFNLTPAGFWNSFRVFWYLLAPFGLAALADRAGLIEHLDISLSDFPSGLFFTTKVFGIGLEWILMPILLWLAADILQIKSRYGGYIIARNWGSLIVGAAYAIPAIAQLSGLIIHEITLFANLLLLGFALYYHYRIARITLDRPAPFCIALVSADFLIGFLIGQTLWSVITSEIPSFPQ